MTEELWHLRAYPDTGWLRVGRCSEDCGAQNAYHAFSGTVYELARLTVELQQANVSEVMVWGAVNKPVGWNICLPKDLTHDELVRWEDAIQAARVLRTLSREGKQP